MLSACQVKQETEDKEIKYPEVMFAKTHVFSQKNMIGYYIDKEGNVYKFDYSEDVYKSQKLYDTFILMEDDIVDTINKDDLYSIYNDFAVMDNCDNKRSQDTKEMEEYGYFRWYGFRYNSNEEIEVILLSGEGDSNLINNNEKALDIVDWIDEVVNNDLKRSYLDSWKK